MSGGDENMHYAKNVKGLENISWPQETKYEDTGRVVGKMVDEKQLAYGDSFHRACEVISILYPDGVQPNQYADMLSMIRVIDKLFRIANQKDYSGESPWKDIAGYGLLGMTIGDK